MRRPITYVAVAIAIVTPGILAQDASAQTPHARRWPGPILNEQAPFNQSPGERQAFSSASLCSAVGAARLTQRR
jgi:hypothetical protein